MIRQALRALLFLSFAFPATTSGQDPLGTEYQLKELRDYVDGLQSFSTNLQRGKRVYDQLVEYSDMQFVVIPAQTFQWGQAHAGGVILLDISTLQKPDDILAYKFAHEWGHEALGHQPNFYRPQGQGWRFFKTPTQDEDEADAYAGKFLAAKKYSIDAVTRYLRNLPSAPGDFAHSSGSKRAQIVRAAFVDASDTSPDCETGQSCEDAIKSCKASGCPCSGLIGSPFLECRKQCTQCLAQAATTCAERNAGEPSTADPGDDEMAEEEDTEEESPIPSSGEVLAELSAARKPPPANEELSQLYEQLKDLLDAAASDDFDGYKGALRPRSSERWTGTLVIGRFNSCEVRESEVNEKLWHQYVCDRRADSDALAVFSETRTILRRLVPAEWARNQSSRTFIVERSENHGPVVVLTHFSDNRVRLTVTGLF